MHRKNSVIVLGMMVFFALMVILRVQLPGRDQEEKQSAVELIKNTLDKGRVVTAREYLAKVLKNKELYVFDERGFINLGVEYLEQEAPHKAVVVFEAAVACFPESQTLPRLLAHAYYVTGNEEGSFEAAEKWISDRNQALLANFLTKNKETIAASSEEVID